MGIIKIMDETLANKIAAGEVVERVSSVVKELVENSIDAKADNIKVELTNAGMKEIKVIDNGIGMSKEDALISFERHATSKVKNETDLNYIHTLGFRGEALASIQSVSDVDLYTNNIKEGTHIHIKGGKLLEDSVYECNKGTTISVKNLFYNTPARLNFLKSYNSELANVTYFLERLALSHTNIRFNLKCDGKEIINTSGSSDLHKTIHELFGYQISSNLKEIKNKNNEYEIYGYIGDINISKSNKNGIITIVNGRVVSNNYLNKVIKDSYHTYLAETKYPYVFLNIYTDATLIDVNIHPTKQDIRFSNMDSLEDLVFSTIRDAFNNDNTKQVDYVGSKINTNNSYQEENQYLNKIDISNIKVENPIIIDDYGYKVEKKQTELSFSVNEEEAIYEKKEDNINLISPVGLALGTYLVAQNKDIMYLIDIHAANERINYEIYFKRLKEKTLSVTPLLVPITIEMTPSNALVINQNKELINSIGINFEEFGINTFRVLSHPTWFKEGFEEESVRKVFDLVTELGSKFDINKFAEKLSINLACKMSVKANTNITLEEQQTLINRLFKCEFPFTCPHGRPTIIEYPKYELEKLFKRVD